jgi:glutamate synthase (NADPH/NADH) small chain
VRPQVTVYERDEGPGGLMRFGVPDAKLEKSIIDRRVALLEQEGIEFVYDADVGSASCRRASCARSTTRS